MTLWSYKGVQYFIFIHHPLVAFHSHSFCLFTMFQQLQCNDTPSASLPSIPISPWKPSHFWLETPSWIGEHTVVFFRLQTDNPLTDGGLDPPHFYITHKEINAAQAAVGYGPLTPPPPRPTVVQPPPQQLSLLAPATSAIQAPATTDPCRLFPDSTCRV